MAALQDLRGLFGPDVDDRTQIELLEEGEIEFGRLGGAVEAFNRRTSQSSIPMIIHCPRQTVFDEAKVYWGNNLGHL